MRVAPCSGGRCRIVAERCLGHPPALGTGWYMQDLVWELSGQAALSKCLKPGMCKCLKAGIWAERR